MNRWQAMFLFFSVLLLTVKLCFFIAQYFITESIASRALKKKELESKILGLADKKGNNSTSTTHNPNIKDLEKYRIMRNR